MTHAIANNEPLSIEQANIFDKYLVAVPGYRTNNAIRRKFEQMVRELTELGYNEGHDDAYELGRADGYEAGFDDASGPCSCGVCHD